MKRKKIATGALIGGLITTPLIAITFLAERLAGFSFLPFDVFSWMTRILPGPLVTFGIDLMIDSLRLLNINVADTAKTAEQAMAVLQFLAIGILAGAIYFGFLHSQQRKATITTGLLLGLIFGLPAVLISQIVDDTALSPAVNGLWQAALFLLWGVSMSLIYNQLQRYQEETEPQETDLKQPFVEKLDRRQFLITLGASAATITVIGAGLGTLLNRDKADGQRTADGDGDTSIFPDPRPLPNADDPVKPAAGTRQEYTPVADHYQVFIGLQPENIDASAWTLPITGLVDNPLELTLEDIQTNYEPISRYITLSCISGRIPTTLISTTYWTGASVQDILEDAGVQEEAAYLYIRSEDGFYETVPLDLIHADPRIMFCYGWDGKPLPKDHGFPLRIWIPDRFGMKQPKWITSVELIGEYKEGYWVERDWDRIARIKTRSVIDSVAVEDTFEDDGQRYVPIGGISFAGDRGISNVELRVDDGPWQKAQLRSPLSDATWVIWRYDWPFQAGEHTFQVRCYDGKGELQVTEDSPARPDGATGIHTIEQNIQDT